jgi:hypothetical protein
VLKPRKRKSKRDSKGTGQVTDDDDDDDDE